MNFCLLLLQRKKKIPGAVNECKDMNLAFRLKYSIKHSVSVSEYKEFAECRICELGNDAAAVREVV